MNRRRVFGGLAALAAAASGISATGGSARAVAQVGDVEGIATPRSIEHADPWMNQWSVTHEQVFENFQWTHEAQGLTTNGQYFFVTSNNQRDSLVGVYRRSLNLRINYGFSPTEAHPGDPDFDFRNNRLYVPVESAPTKVYVFRPDLSLEKVSVLGGTGPKPQGPWFSWCAVRPSTGFVYSCVFADGVVPTDRIFGYAPGRNFELVREVFLPVPASRVQGGFITANDHLYLSCDTEPGKLLGYKLQPDDGTSVAGQVQRSNAIYLGSKDIKKAWGFEEVEGVVHAHLTWANGASDTWISVLVLDNDAPSRDDVIMKHYSVPDPSRI